MITAAGVSRSTFYDNFESKRECIEAAHSEATKRLLRVVQRACARAEGWPQRVAAGVRAAIRFAVESPDEANLLLFPAVGLDAGRAATVVAPREQLVGMLRVGREHSAQAAEMPALVERILIGGASMVIASRFMRDRADSLIALECELVHLMLLPYVGSAEARRIATSTE